MSERKKKPMNFGRVMLASALGTLCVFLVGWILIFILSLSMVAGLSKDTTSSVTVNDGTFLSLTLEGNLPERTLDKIQRYASNGSGLGMNDLLRSLEVAANDKKIEGIYLKLSALTALSWGQAEELRDALQEFKQSGKKIIAYGDALSQTGYYIASAADEIVVHPSGMVEFRGIGGEVMFYKDLLDKLDVQMQLIRPVSCAYKSAGEVYTMNHLSDANKTQIRAYISSIWNHVCQNISLDRGISVDSLNLIADNLSGYLAEDAQEAGLIDSCFFESELRTYLKEKYKGKHLLAINQYNKNITPKAAHNANSIAIVYAEGNVVDGKQKGLETNIYGEDMVKALDEAARDKDVKAVVLRVNSPGGSVIASEAITNAVRRLKKEKPLVVSMSDVAASAGYEISCYADCIVAQPTTITGSIGVFATLPNVGNMMRKKIGLTTDTVQTNRNSTGLTIFRPLSPTARTMMQRNVEDFYLTFVNRVAEGRKSTFAHIDSIAKGRVWTGEDALHIGLVDTLGGLKTAIAIAAGIADVKDYRVVDYPAEKDIWTRMAELYGDGNDEQNINLMYRIQSAWNLRSIKRNGPTMMDRIDNELNYIANAQGMQARLEFVFFN